MTYIPRFLFVIGFLGFAGSLGAQSSAIVTLGNPKVISPTSQLPETTTNSRSVVVVSTPNKKQGRFEKRGDWKSLCEEVHKNFRSIGIDAIAYVYRDDLDAGPEVRSSYLRLFENRNVKNLIFVKKSGDFPEETYEMMVARFDPTDYVQNGQSVWMESHNSLDRIMLRLGRQVLRQELERSNFLIPEKPEYLDDLVIFTGTRLENYPSRLASLKLAVVRFQEATAENVFNPDVIQTIEAYNKEVRIKNEKLVQILENYPFKYELVDTNEEKKLYQEGFQYALMPLQSTGIAIKNILNYPVNQAETHYMTSSFDETGKPDLVKIPVGANVTKYYIKQTIVMDIHTGNVWDADITWEQALENFLYNLRKAFNK